MKTVYFVRHGETEDNAKKLHGRIDEPLSGRGHEQADVIAKRVMNLSAQALVASTMIRARQTAEHIAHETGLVPEYSDLFIESLGPKKYMGVPHDDPEAAKAFRQIVENYSNPDWRFLDAENFKDHTARAHGALRFLAHRPEERIVVVTHGLFLRILLAHVIFWPQPTPQEIQKITNHSETKNTGLTVFEYDEERVASHSAKKLDPWRLWVWNDHAHLAD